MTYGYDSSEPNLTVSVGPDTWPTLSELAAHLGYRQTRGATAGQGSVSALARALADAARYNGVHKTATKLRWIADYTADRPPDRERRDHRLLVGDHLPHLRSLARTLDLVATRSTTTGKGSVSALLEALAAAAHSDPEAIARRLKWLAN